MARKTKLLSESTADLSKEKIARKKMLEDKIKEETMRDQLQDPPHYLDRIAKNEWKRIIQALPESSIVSNLDKTMLATLCDTYSNWRDLQKKLKNAGPSSYREIYMMLSKSQQDMIALYKTLGLNPANRIEATKKQLEKNENELEDTFGDI